MSVEEFFNLEIPCDCSIRDCEVLRNDYRIALENLNSTGCSECQKTALKAHFMCIISECLLPRE